MNEQSLMTADDDLLRLWQETALRAPDPERLARSVGRMQLARFDRAVLGHDFREYAAFLFLLAFFSFQWLLGGDRVQAVMAVGGALFVVSYLFWQHRGLVPLDPSSDARAYQAALLARIDGQIRLLKGIRYWYLLPLYLPVIWTVTVAWRRNAFAAAVGFFAMTAIYAVVAWHCERSAVSRLRVERKQIETLYEQDSL